MLERCEILAMFISAGGPPLLKPTGTTDLTSSLKCSGGACLYFLIKIILNISGCLVGRYIYILYRNKYPSGSENQEILRLIFTVSKTRALQLYAKQMSFFNLLHKL